MSLSFSTLGDDTLVAKVGAYMAKITPYGEIFELQVRERVEQPDLWVTLHLQKCATVEEAKRLAGLWLDTAIGRAAVALGTGR